MHLPSYLRLGLALIAVALAGCQHAPQASAPVRNRPVAYALAVTVRDGLHPSPSQWAAIQSTFARALAANGMVLVTDVGMADRILRIDFIPDPEDPENHGRAIIVGVRANDQRNVVAPPAPLIASYHAFPYPFGWSGYGWNGYYYGFGWDPYYGYGNTYFDGYTYATPTLNPRRPKLPPGSRPPDELAHHHHRHPRPPEDPLRPRRTVPPAEDPRPPLLAASEPPRAAASSPRTYPTSDPRELVFADDVRRTNRYWLADGTPYNRHDNPRYTGERASGAANSPASGNENSSYRSRTTGDRERTYAQSSTDDSRGGRYREDSARSRSDDHSRASSGSGSSYSHSNNSGSYTAASSGSSYSSGSSSSSASYSSGASYSSSSASSSGGSSTPVGGSGPSAAPTTTNQAEK
jgi:hypothetical protein